MDRRGTDIVLCSPLRTAVGAFGGGLASVPVERLAAEVVAAVVRRAGLAAEDVDDVVLGHAYASAEAPNLGRVAALDAGLPPRRVWDALCTHMGVPPERRLGKERPLRRGPVEE